MSTTALDLAARNLARHRTRTLISLSAIVFGVVALVLAGGFVEWIFWATREAAIQTGLGHIQISRPGFRAKGLADPSRYLLAGNAPELTAIGAMPGVVAVQERLILSGLASSGETTVAFTGEALDPDSENVISRVLAVKGDGLDRAHPDGVLLGHGLAAGLGIKPGDRVSFIVSLPGGGVNAVEGTVRGTFTTEIKAYDDSAVRMPIALGQQLLRTQGAHLWVVALDDTARTDDVAELLTARLPPQQFEFTTWLELSDFYRKAVTLLSRQLGAVGLLIGCMIVLGISNTLTMNVLERTGEIGTLMAMGTPRARILRLFMLEGIVLGVAGGVLGLLLGVGLAWLLSAIGIPMPPPPGRESGYDAEILLTPGLLIGAFGVAAVATALASVYPAWRAAHLPIVDSLRHNR